MARTKEMPNGVNIHRGYDSIGDPFYELIHEQIGYLGRVSLYDKGGLRLGKQIGVKIETLEKQSDETTEHYLSRMDMFIEASNILRDALYNNFPQSDTDLVTITNSIGETYEGQIENGMPNGLGRFILQTGIVVYEGYWVDGVWGGFGKLFYANGKLMCYGEFRNGTVNGYARFYDEDGNITHEGYFVDNKTVK